MIIMNDGLTTYLLDFRISHSMVVSGIKNDFIVSKFSYSRSKWNNSIKMEVRVMNHVHCTSPQYLLSVYEV